ncbi:exosome complex protein Rrp42 [Candidatus Woesearchaeota archaeon]|nr:exosome complex protein Rrp42 [Candidatus Woesearchaeota archaeon]
MSASLLNDTMQQHLTNALNKGIRFDGRKLDEWRPVKVEYGISKTAEGSARVKIGETEVLAGVKLFISEPYPDMPEDGSLMVGAELLPMASPEFEAGPPDVQSIELARVVDRGIREAKAIDTKKLCIKAGEKVWIVSIDICTVNDDGNLLDASSLAALAALQDAVFPHYDGTELDYRQKTKQKLPLTKLPIAVTVYKIGKNLLVDPSPVEERTFDVRLTVTTTQGGMLCALQKGGDGQLTLDEIKQMVELGLQKSAELRKCLKA